MTTEPARLTRQNVTITSAWVGAILLAVLHWWMAVGAAATHSATFDEPAHLASGYSFWLTDDYRLMPDGGILPKRLATLPLVLSDMPRIDLEHPEWDKASPFGVGMELMYGSGRHAERMLDSARRTTAIFGAATVLLVFAWSSQLFGTAAGLLSALIAAFSPTLLAHSPLVTSDVAAALFFGLSSWSLWLLLNHLSWKNLLLSTGATTALALSKFSAPLLLPVAAILVLVRLRQSTPMTGTLVKLIPRGRTATATNPPSLSRRSEQLTVIGLLVAVHIAVLWVAIWSAYGWRYDALASGDASLLTNSPYWSMGNGDSAGHHIIDVAKKYHLLPEAYLHGMSFTLVSASARLSFLNGDYSVSGWRSFFPLAVLYKTPPAILALLLLAALVIAIQPKSRRNPLLYQLTPVGALLVVYGAVAINSSINIGHRHILPLYPLFFVLLGAAAGLPAVLKGRVSPAISAVIVPIIVLGLVISSATIRPHYLSYFNKLAGGPENGWRRMVDSSLDWGQDLPRVNQWLTEHQRAGEPVYLAWFGIAPPSYYGVTARPLPSFADNWHPRKPPTLEAGLYLISATQLQVMYTQCPGPWNRRHESQYRRVANQYEEIFPNQSATPDASAVSTRPEWLNDMRRYEQLRFCRLASALRQHEPQAQIGYSVMVYRLGTDFIRQALAYRDSPVDTIVHPVDGADH